MTPDPCQHLRLSRTIVGETAFYKCSDGWISVKKRLPEMVGGWEDRGGRDQFSNSAPVLVLHKQGMSVAEVLRTVKYADKFEAQRDVWVSGDETVNGVTHWQPLPPPPDSACHRNFTAEPLTIKVSYPEPRAQEEGN